MKNLSLLLLLLSFTGTYSQCSHMTPITNADQMVIDGTLITVSSTGVGSTFENSFCNHTTPYFYWVGYGTGPAASGSYIFTFDPPSQGVMLDFMSIDNFDGDFSNPPLHEEVQLFLNGSHYAVPAPGMPLLGNGPLCDQQLATLTPQGNIAGNRGWRGTFISGPITTLEVHNRIIDGTPGGSTFHIYVCDNNLANPAFSANDSGWDLYVQGNALQLHCSKNPQKAMYEIHDLLGRSIKAGPVEDRFREVSLDDLQRGIYVVKVIEDGTPVFSKKFFRQ